MQSSVGKTWGRARAEHQKGESEIGASPFPLGQWALAAFLDGPTWHEESRCSYPKSAPRALGSLGSPAAPSHHHLHRHPRTFLPALRLGPSNPKSGRLPRWSPGPSTWQLRTPGTVSEVGRQKTSSQPSSRTAFSVAGRKPCRNGGSSEPPTRGKGMRSWLHLHSSWDSAHCRLPIAMGLTLLAPLTMNPSFWGEKQLQLHDPISQLNPSPEHVAIPDKLGELEEEGGSGPFSVAQMPPRGHSRLGKGRKWRFAGHCVLE